MTHAPHLCTPPVRLLCVACASRSDGRLVQDGSEPASDAGNGSWGYKYAVVTDRFSACNRRMGKRPEGCVITRCASAHGNGGNKQANRNSEYKGDKRMGTENKRRIGEAVVLILFFIFDGYEFWPTSHLIALSAAILGTSAVFFAEMPIRAWIISSAGLVFVAAVIYFTASPILPEETETHGWLLPANDDTPHNSCGSIGIGKGQLLVIVGSNALVNRGTQKFQALNVGSCPVISFDRNQEGLAIDADVFDEAGILVARVESNEFHLVPGQYSYSKRPDRSTLVVFNREGHELLRIRYLNPLTAQIRGIFACKGSEPIIVTDEAVMTVGRKAALSIGNCLFDDPAGIRLPVGPSRAHSN